MTESFRIATKWNLFCQLLSNVKNELTLSLSIYFFAVLFEKHKQLYNLYELVIIFDIVLTK